MKRKKKLQLNRETVRSLGRSQLRHAAGGDFSDLQGCTEFSCEVNQPTCICQDSVNCGTGGGTGFCPPPTNPDCNYWTVGPCEQRGSIAWC